MPHFRSRSWEQKGVAVATSWYSSGSDHHIDNDIQHSPLYATEDEDPGQFFSIVNGKQTRTRSIPAIMNPEHYSPAPFSKPAKRRRHQSVDAASDGPLRSALLPQISPLPSLPGSAYYSPRHELQRRGSPTSMSFSSGVSATPPLTPSTPVTPPVTTTSIAQPPPPEQVAHKSTLASAANEDAVYVLTLRTSPEIARQMDDLRTKWFPADRLKIPAHITLFHALPGSRLGQVSQHIQQLASRINRFEISTGRIAKTKKGVLVGLEAGEHEARRVFVSLRTSWWEWLSEQDKSFKAHWTVQNKEDDSKRVEEAFRDTERAGAGLGWATGLVLWRYEDDGRWTMEREFGFANSRRGKDGPRS